ncbi:hypothetical protein K8R66_03045 [bacterium]|nr:hypothetical protein [bacterium]
MKKLMLIILVVVAGIGILNAEVCAAFGITGQEKDAGIETFIFDSDSNSPVAGIRISKGMSLFLGYNFWRGMTISAGGGYTYLFSNCRVGTEALGLGYYGKKFYIRTDLNLYFDFNKKREEEISFSVGIRSKWLENLFFF